MSVLPGAHARLTSQDLSLQDLRDHPLQPTELFGPSSHCSLMSVSLGEKELWVQMGPHLCSPDTVLSQGAPLPVSKSVYLSLSSLSPQRNRIQDKDHTITSIPSGQIPTPLASNTLRTARAKTQGHPAFALLVMGSAL